MKKDLVHRMNMRLIKKNQNLIEQNAKLKEVLKTYIELLAKAQKEINDLLK